jgi:tetratricopeptide (TPR) repeat protein
MPLIILIIIILGAGLGAISFFVIKSFILPKKFSNLEQMLKQGKTSSVTRGAKQMLAKEPRSMQAHYLLGQAYLMDNKPELALMEFKTVNQIGDFGGAVPEKQFREKIAALFEKYNQPEEALKEYLLLIKLEPHNGEYYFKSGKMFEARDKSEKALNYYRKALQLEPRHAEAHFKLGFLLYRNKKPVEAKAELEAAINTDPGNYKAYYYIGKLLKDGHDYIGALHAFEKAQRDPEFKIKALVERGACYLNTQSYENAVAELERAIKITTDPGSAETLFAKYFLANVYEKTRNVDKAVGLWEEIYAKKSSFRDVAEKLSQYQDIQTDDYVKDFHTAPMDQFYEMCKSIAEVIGLNVQDIKDIPNGCEILGVEAESKMRNVRKIPKLVRLLRVAELIPESTVRALQDEMKSQNVPRGIIITSSNFSRKAVDFASNRPIDLYGKEQLQQILKKADI